MQYVPLHDRPPYYASPPTPPPNSTLVQRYTSPDLDLSTPLFQHSMSEDEQAQQATQVAEAGPSRKRPRQADSADASEEAWDNGNGHVVPVPAQQHRAPGIVPSLFGVSARNEFTKTIGEFIMAHAQGRDHIEIEIKLGTLMAPSQGGPPHRVRLPTMSESILPSDYPIGNFSSTMTKKQNQTLNKLLNDVTSESHSPNSPNTHPIQFFRARHIDSFYNIASSQRGGGKVRVSRDREGNIVPDGVIRKRRIGDLNVYSPRSAFDWRISINTEEPTEMPSGPPASTREKDRACYRHQLCQVDLTVVTTRNADGSPPSLSYELEIEILDVPALLAEGAKDSDLFDDMLQSVLDTARMLIRNV